MEVDYELFLQELEEDPELRSGVNIYKNYTATNQKRGRQPSSLMEIEDQMNPRLRDVDNESESESEIPEIDISEMLDDLDLNDDDDESDEVEQSSD